jgi:hypothetical protein
MEERAALVPHHRDGLLAAQDSRPAKIVDRLSLETAQLTHANLDSGFVAGLTYKTILNPKPLSERTGVMTGQHSVGGSSLHCFLHSIQVHGDTPLLRL